MKNILLISLVLVFFVACSKVNLPEKRMVEVKNQDFTYLSKQLNKYPKDKIPYQEFANKKITEVKVGDENLYGITISKDLKIAYDGYLSGDGKSALDALERIKKDSSDDRLLWQASFLKIQTLIMMGLGDDAFDEVDTCIKYERKSFNSDLNCISLRGELNVWQRDYEAAKKDAISVLLTIGDWEFPTTYGSPPGNMPELVATTTAQMRAYTTLAALYNMLEDYESSYYWAYEGEKRMNAVHYVSNHWLYGKFVNLHLDSYYGRASNLLFLATAELAIGFDPKITKLDFERAERFFKMISYEKGVATILALKARVYNRLGKHQHCYTIGKQAIDYSLKHGFLDFVWRIESIRGETFLKLGKDTQAQESFRRAEDVLIKLSGSFNEDISKVMFGITTKNIIENLVRIDIEKNNLDQLLIDIENYQMRSTIDISKKKVVKITDRDFLQKVQNSLSDNQKLVYFLPYLGEFGKYQKYMEITNNSVEIKKIDKNFSISELKLAGMNYLVNTDVIQTQKNNIRNVKVIPNANWLNKR